MKDISSGNIWYQVLDRSNVLCNIVSKHDVCIVVKHGVLALLNTLFSPTAMARSITFMWRLHILDKEAAPENM